LDARLAVAVSVVIGIIALAFGVTIGYSFSPQKISTVSTTLTIISSQMPNTITQTATRLVTVTLTTARNETTTLTEIGLTGECNSTDYFLPDIVQLVPATATTVLNGTTTNYVATKTISATTQTINSTEYATTITTDVSTSFVTTNTTNLNPLGLSSEWAVSVCTFTP
jgi:hypothetical protein